MDVKGIATAAALAGALIAAPAALGQQPPGQQPQTRAGMPETKMDSPCQQLLTNYQQTVNLLQQGQQKTEQLLASVRAAKTQEQRIEALEATVAQLVEQRRYGLEQLERLNAQRVAQMLQASPLGSVACDLLTPLPMKPQQ